MGWGNAVPRLRPGDSTEPRPQLSRLKSVCVAAGRRREGRGVHGARLRRLLLYLSITVSTNPYWETLTGNVVEERMALKHTPGALTQPPTDDLADVEGLAAQAV
ncbi:hypothetical protein OHT93_00410 [Streptomyces sp. NBC_00191]|uniref:hypothetical protein n=1 Tax=Streptomyces sp. NBC_00191 TaxID=2975674 RepID=UPI00324F13CF